MKFLLKRLVLAFASMVAVSLMGMATAAHAEPVKIRVGWVSSPPSLVPVFEKAGVAENDGITYDFEPVYFAGSSTGITAVQAGELELVNLNFITLPIAVQNAGLDDLKVVMSEIVDGQADAFSMPFMVRSDSGIRSIEDLRGKVIATIGRGSGVHLGMTAILEAHDLQENRDYTLIESPFPTMKGLLRDRKADLVVFTAGFAADPELAEFAETLFTLKDAFGGPSALSFFAVRQSFIDDHRDALVDFLADMIRVQEWLKDPENRQAAVSIMSEQSKIPEPVLAPWIFSEQGDFYRDPGLAVDADVLQSNVDLMHELGFIRQPIEVSQHLDLSVLQDAASEVR